MAYYTKTQWIEMLQAKLGTQVGTDNKRFTPDLCDAALRQSIRPWQPWLPPGCQDNNTEMVTSITATVTVSGTTTLYQYLLPDNAARLLGAEISGYTVELYGIGRKGMDYNAWVDAKTSRSNLANGRVYLLCYVGKMLLIAPTPPMSAPTVNALIRTYPTWPTEMGNNIYVPESTIPFHLAQAASLGKWGDLKDNSAMALQQESLAMLKTVFGIQDREAEQS